MSNIIDFSRKTSKKPVTPTSPVDDLIESMKKAFTTGEDTNSLLKKIKGVLRSRGIKYRVQLKQNQPNVDKKLSLLFPEKLTGFSLSIKEVHELENGWVIYPIDEKKGPADNAGMIIQVLQEKNNG